ncbi:MAG: transglutaminase family protein, partial [Gammaproteobacteria bacterium]
APQLLSRLIVYLNHHPSLSYWFAPVYVGSYSQSPRTDENVRETFSELQVALQHLAATEAPMPEFIWRSLSPFLVDTSGNAHRSEINIEKLWNPYLPGRGCLGLVEFRAFRMAMDAESAAAIAAMLRALAVMLARQESHPALIEWGSRLHDRFALPFYQLQDLRTVFDDLQSAGLGLGEPITRRLCSDNWRHVGDAELAGCRLDVNLAIEFWPLLGDAAEQAGGSRLVDASTRRLQLTLRPCGELDSDLDGWRLLVGNYRVPLRREQDDSGMVLITGLRYRAFVPWTGLHPGLAAQTPIVLYLLPPGGGNGLRCTLHDWQPEGKPYDGLPDNLDEARKRIAERFEVEEITPDQAPDAVAPPDEAVTDYCLDLRRT